MSQGHTEMVSMRHYLNLPFTREEMEEIRIRTDGWIGAKESHHNISCYFSYKIFLFMYTHKKVKEEIEILEINQLTIK